MELIEIVSPPCVLCRETQTFLLPRNKVEAWKSGEHIQHVFPELTAAEREKLISGSCDECFSAMFPPDDDES